MVTCYISYFHYLSRSNACSSSIENEVNNLHGTEYRVNINRTTSTEERGGEREREEKEGKEQLWYVARIRRMHRLIC